MLQYYVQQPLTLSLAFCRRRVIVIFIAAVEEIVPRSTGKRSKHFELLKTADKMALVDANALRKSPIQMDVSYPSVLKTRSVAFI
jgi:hypothetical protein